MNILEKLLVLAKARERLAGHAGGDVFTHLPLNKSGTDMRLLYSELAQIPDVIEAVRMDERRKVIAECAAFLETLRDDGRLSFHTAAELLRMEEWGHGPRMDKPA